MFRNIVTGLHNLKHMLFNYLMRGPATDECNIVKPGVFKCRIGGAYSLVALYTISSGGTSVSDLDYTDAVYHMKRFLNIFSMPGCRTIMHFSLQPIDVDSYISEINRKLQMKLVELDLDKSNTKLRSYVEKLISVRRRVLMGMTPVSVSNIIAFICSDNSSNIEKLTSFEHSARSSLNITIAPIVDPMKVYRIINF